MTNKQTRPKKTVSWMESKPGRWFAMSGGNAETDLKHDTPG